MDFKEFLEKVNLIDFLTTRLEIQKKDFITIFEKEVDEQNTSFLFDGLDFFSSSDNLYKGHVKYDEFRIKRKKKLFDSGTHLAIALGTYTQVGNHLIIDTEIRGLNGKMIFFYAFCIIFYVIVFIAFISIGFNDNQILAIFLLFLPIHAIFMLGIPYLLMRKSMKKMKYSLERDFHQMVS